MSDTPPLEVRALRFAIDAQRTPRHWLGGRAGVTRFLDNLSTFFPAGERFFIASVLAHRDRVTDPALLAAVKAFAAQEGHHTREHVRYNQMLRDQGLPVEVMEARVERLLERVKRVTPARLQLAATCALEHLTALMAHMVLADDRVLAGADPEMAALWRWHAAEENEHKAVAFDVFLAAGGTSVERVLAMVVASLIFWAKVGEHQVRLMAADGTLWSPREWRALGRFLFVSPGPLRKVAGAYLAYYRPGFHPWDIDSRALLEKWRAHQPPAVATAG